jgi:predicted nucleotidyltransferase
MMTRDQVLRRLRTEQDVLQEMGVLSLALFGSLAQGTARPDSDVDLLVEFSRPVGLFDFVRLQNRLEQIVGCPVDLVTPDSLRDSMRLQILGEAVYVVPQLATTH